MQTRSSDEKSLSVRLSNAYMNGRKICPDFYTMPCSLIFWEEEWLVGANPSTWNFGSTGPRWNEIADFEAILARSASAVTPSEKSSIHTIVGRLLCAFQWRWSSYVSPKPLKGGWKTQNGRFGCKIALRSKKVSYKVSLCENCQRQSLKALIGL